MGDNMLYEGIVVSLILIQLMAIAYRAMQLLVAMANEDIIIGKNFRLFAKTMQTTEQEEQITPS
jgi:hypothetical protein